MKEEYAIYEGFAGVYDLFMDNIPYQKWHEYLRSLLLEFGIDRGKLVELACGTGTMTQLLSQDGYEMTGVDLSEEMLAIARDKCAEDVFLLHQDMRQLELFGSVRGMVCVCDGMNYLLTEKDLRQTFCAVRRHLDEGGVFIFDMKTDYFYREVLGSRVIAENRENASFFWENCYDLETGVNEYILTVYELVDTERDLFARYDELHRQKAFSIVQVQGLLREAGLTCVAVYDAFTREAPKEQSERVCYVCRS